MSTNSQGNLPAREGSLEGLRQGLELETGRAVRHQRPCALLCLSAGAASDLARPFQALVQAVRQGDLVAADADGALWVLMPETGDTAPLAARRLLDVARDLRLGAAAGLARCPDDGSDPETLMQAAYLGREAAGPGEVACPAQALLTGGAGGKAVVVADPAMRRLFTVLDDLAGTELPVLITGATGAGKEVVAAALHGRSPRSRGPMVSINCAAVPEALLESELFGHERGAFSGAVATKPGLFEAAQGGVLFLDEISETAPRLQASLLRVLETRAVRRVGAVSERVVDVRVVAASNRDLKAEVEAGRFRRDLYYRLGAASLDVPGLAQRRVEIPILLRAFLAEACAAARRPVLDVAPAAQHRLNLYDWPGNVRELKNMVSFLASTVRGRRLMAEDLPAHVVPSAWKGWLARPAERPAGPDHGGAAPVFATLADEVRDLERRRIREALEAEDGVRVRAAARLGMPLRTLVTKMRVYELSSFPRRGRSRQAGL